jgi:hypothetical protein
MVAGPLVRFHVQDQSETEHLQVPVQHTRRRRASTRNLLQRTCCATSGDVVLQPRQHRANLRGKPSTQPAARASAPGEAPQTVPAHIRKTIRKPRRCKNKGPRFLKPVPAKVPPSGGSAEKQKSVLDMLVAGAAIQRISEAESQPRRQPSRPIGSKEAYIDDVKRRRASFVKACGPWVLARRPFAEAVAINAQRQRSGERLLDAAELLNLHLRPSIFVWDLAAIFPNAQVLCPTCGSPGCRSSWRRPRNLHHLHGQSTYITLQYLCYSCGSAPVQSQPANRKRQARRKKYFLADDPQVLASMPKPVSSAWSFTDTGRILCDATVVDFIRAMATRATWSALADAINEMKSTAWLREVQLPYLHLCHYLGVQPVQETIAFPSELRLSSDWVRTAYVADAAARAPQTQNELLAEVGDDVFRVDWTKDAASRCGGAYLLNIMDGRGFILLSELTSTSKPLETKKLMIELLHRGARPKVVYVDEECCGAWASMLQDIWPGVQIKLDAMHALRRVMQTTSCTQHPWHGQFCAMLTEAVYTEDVREADRLRRARECEGYNGLVPKSVKAKFVPRHILDAPQIARAIQTVIDGFGQKAHPEAGPLLTTATKAAWANLKEHVLKGCLCDPAGVNVNSASGTEASIGGERFEVIRVLRGTSPLEGFHSHQKQWLGTFGRHAAEAGKALLSDGAVRWNRRRRCEENSDEHRHVFAGELLGAVDDLRRDDANELSKNGETIA